MILYMFYLQSNTDYVFKWQIFNDTGIYEVKSKI